MTKTQNSAHHAGILWQAVIFDLDGVVTDTAAVHARAWKTMFDGFLEAQRREQTGKADIFSPFDIENDYRRYVDGKPRYDGVADFLESRNISLPFGRPSDPPEKTTICGLGNRKNRLFLKSLQEEGAIQYEPVVRLIRRLKTAGIKTAVVSSSKNCADVLKSAAISDLFDTRVDGKTSEKLHLKGKPAPDIFLKAAEKLNVRPQQAMVVEDAVAGVKAGQSGHFGCVVGMNRDHTAQQLLDNGADRTVTGGDELEALITENQRSTADLPSALLPETAAVIAGKRTPIVFLDFDGTLSPIVDRPDQATLPPETAHTLARLKGLCRIAIISGRDLKDVRERTGIEGLYYAGSHGFDIVDPQQQEIRIDQGADALPALNKAENQVREKTASISGVEVERKKFSIAVHFRRAPEDQIDAVEDIVDQVNKNHPELRKSHGKKIFELQPDVDWNKGKALRHLLKIMGVENRPDQVLPVYIGDDVTDEDAFRVLRLDGMGIVVHRGKPKPTQAGYRLADPGEVDRFLKLLIHRLEEK